MNFTKDYILENEIVKLKPLVPEDYQILSEFAISEPTLW